MGIKYEALATRESNGKTRWTKIGVVFENRDGSLSVVLDANPLDGRIQLREPRQNERAQREAQDEEFKGQF